MIKETAGFREQPDFERFLALPAGEEERGKYPLETVLFGGYEVLSGMLPFAVVTLLWGNRQKKRGQPLNGGIRCMALVLALYAVGMYYFTGVGTVYDLFTYGAEIRSEQINLLPFSRTIDGTAYGLNILLFLPFGLLSPWFCDRMASWKKVLEGGFSLSLLIEVSQLLNNRSTDVDDLILNTLGALVGWGLYRLLRRYLPRLARPLPLPLLWMSFLIPFAGRFLLFDEIALARWLYGF